MAVTDSAFVGSIPEIYERLLAPMIFAEPARHTAAAVMANRPTAVLETAAGTGVLTRALVESGAANVTATDLNQPMIDLAKSLCRSPTVRWQVADALDLPLPDRSFDVVVCQFGVMFFPDRPRGYAEARRVLRPGGAYVAKVLAGGADNQLVAELKRSFTTVKHAKPPASRKDSSEWYVIAQGFKDLGTGRDALT